ncbi:MAG: hypothetical protein MZW92_53225 [Comamonadaceae bacterium]|nr:hypothetical protein [Comamonadaceae bacterium]
MAVSPPGSAAMAASELSRCDVIIPDDVPARSLGEEWMRAMAAHVERDAGGLIMIGGAGSFGPGGFAARSGGERAAGRDGPEGSREEARSRARAGARSSPGAWGRSSARCPRSTAATDAVLRLSGLLTADDALRDQSRS